MSKLTADIADQTYRDFEAKIDKIVQKFAYRYNCDESELRSAADEIYLKAFLRFAPTQGTPLEHWICYNLYKGLLEILRQKISKNNRLRRVLINLEASSRKEPRFCLLDFFDRLSKDAVLVVQLALETPSEIEHAIKVRGGKPRNYRSAIRDFLSKLGWRKSRIQSTFSEIGEALQG
jgi:hypothetical protein